MPNHTVLPHSGKTAQSSTEVGTDRAINRPYPSTCTPPHSLRPEHDAPPCLAPYMHHRPRFAEHCHERIVSPMFFSLRGSDSICDDDNQSIRTEGNRLHSWNRLPPSKSIREQAEPASASASDQRCTPTPVHRHSERSLQKGTASAVSENVHAIASPMPTES